MKRNENSGGQASMGLSAQTILLIRLKLRNCLGLNEVIHGKDGRKSLRLTGMLLAYLLLGGMMIFYLTAAAFLLCLTGAGESVPAFAALVSGGVIFIFSFLKAGPLLFDAADLERLLPLPLQPVSIIVSRFFILYVEELLFSAAIVLPASLVYLVMERPGAGFLLTTLLALPFQPLLPLTAAAVLGTLVLAAGAGMKHRGAVPVILTLGLSMLVVAGSFALSFTVGMEDPDVGELGGLLEAAVAAGTRFYPPAGLYAAGVTDQGILPLLLFGKKHYAGGCGKNLQQRHRHQGKRKQHHSSGNPAGAGRRLRKDQNPFAGEYLLRGSGTDRGVSGRPGIRADRLREPDSEIKRS